VKDLSNTGTPLLGNESEAGTNTISQNQPFSSPGGESESSHGIPLGTPGPVIPAVEDFHTYDRGEGAGPGAPDWEDISGMSGWR
jgi:hypothetical protein